MFLLHYIVPFVIFYFYRNKIMLYGLLLGNLIDLDHVYFRLIGKVGYSESACSKLLEQCSFGFYPLHNWYFAFIFLSLSFLIFTKGDKFKLIGWISFGAILNLILDYIHLISGIGI